MAGTAYYATERSISRSFERFAGCCAIVAGMLILLYSVSSIVIAPRTPNLATTLGAVLLLLGGLLNSAVIVAVCIRLQETDAVFAVWALLLGVVGALGSMVHGGYDLANALNPPASSSIDLPNPIDPRGLLTFGLTGVVVLVIAWLIRRGGQFSYGLGYLGYLLGVLLIITYAGRLTAPGSTNPVILGSTLLAGFVVSPVWHIWIGVGLLRGPRL